MKGDQLRRRMDAVEALIRPPGSLRARIAALGAADRVAYENYLRQLDAWHAGFPKSQNAYEALLDEAKPPEMPRHLARLLHGDEVAVRASDNPDVISRMWDEVRG